MKNTMFDVAFTVVHLEDDPYDVPVTKLIEAATNRLIYLSNNLDEAKEAFGVSDTYEIEE